MRKAQIGVFLLNLCLSIAACQKKDDIKPSSEINFTGEPTAIGQPTGEKVSQSIGQEGGSIRTADGKASLTIPAGALTQTTLITMEPIENKAFQGIGSAYQFSPDGLQFAKPATLTLQYQENDLTGTAPEAIGVAYQDDKQVWQGILAEVNTSNHTFMATLPHFSSWAFFKYYSLYPEVATLAPDQVQKLEVLYLKGSALDPDFTNTSGGQLNPVPLVAAQVLKANQVKNWQVNGEDLNGKFSEHSGGLSVLAQGAAAEYKAPAIVPPAAYNPVAVSVELKSRQGQLMLVSNLTIAAENQMTIDSKKFENPITEADYFENFFYLLMTDRRASQEDVAGLGASIAEHLSGPGSFSIGETCNVTAKLSDKDHLYSGSWVDAQGKIQYGPGSVNITQFNGKGKPVAGTITATLHYQSEDLQVHKTISVKASFRATVSK